MRVAVASDHAVQRASSLAMYRGLESAVNMEARHNYYLTYKIKVTNPSNSSSAKARLFLDSTNYFGFLNKNAAQLSQLLLEEEKLWLNAGTMYGTSGERFLRINIACPRALLLEGLERLEKCYDKVV